MASNQHQAKEDQKRCRPGFRQSHLGSCWSWAAQIESLDTWHHIGRPELQTTQLLTLRKYIGTGLTTSSASVLKGLLQHRPQSFVNEAFSSS